MPGKVAIVTGASRGIGRAIALQLSRHFSVVVNYRSSAAEAQSVVDNISQAGGRAVAVQADVGTHEGRATLIETTLDTFGRIDVLVNNAGISVPQRVDLLDLPPDSWDIVLRTNLEGPFFLSQHAAKVMIRQRREGRLDRGVIVNISSVSADMVSTDRAPYCVAKAGLGMVTKLFAARLAEAGIHVYEVRPGVIRTDMTRAVWESYERRLAAGLAPMKRPGEADEVARAVLLLCTGELTYSTGEVLYVDGGLHIARL